MTTTTGDQLHGSAADLRPHESSVADGVVSHGSTWNSAEAGRSKLEMAGWLAGFMAHEVNNHLAAAMMEIELTLEGPHSDDTRAMLERILIAVESAGDVCRSTLGMLRPESATKSTPGSVGEAIARTVACLGKMRGRVVVRAESALEQATTPLPLAQLQQVVLNLVLNALRESPGEVVISVARVKAESISSTWNHEKSHTEAGGAWVCIAVLDDGPGMPPAVIAQLASAPHPDRIEPINGGGFGLAAVKHLVHTAGGTVRATRLGTRGTRVDVLLPIALTANTRKSA